MNHRIQKQILALDIPSGGDSWRFQNELRDTFNELVLPRLEKACDDMGVGEDTVIKIDSLLLDTGEISKSGFSSEWVKAIEYQFREQIRLVKAQGNSQIHQVEVQSSEESELSLVLHFLKLGVVPWWARQQETIDLNEMLEKLSEKQPSALLSGLKRQPNKPLAIKRLRGILKASSFRNLQQQLGIKRPLVEQLETEFFTSKPGALKTALATLELVEFEEVLQQPNVTAETVFYQWLLAVKKVSKADFSKITESIKLHLVNTLSKSTKVLLDKNTQTALVSAYERLVQENKSEEYQKTGEVASKKLLDQKQKNTPASEPKALDPNSESKRPESKNHADSDEHSIDSNSSLTTEQGVNTNVNSDTKKSAYDEHRQSLDGKHQFEEGPAPVSAEDEHVFRQLEKIRAAAKAKQEQQETAPVSNSDVKSDKEDRPTSNEGKIKGEEALKKPQSEALNQDKNGEQAQPGKDEKSLQTNSKAKGSEQSSSSASDSNTTEKTALATNTKTGEVSPLVDSEKNEATPYPYDLSRIEEVEECYIENAGLVLFWPFLGRFFTIIGLMENGAFLSLEHQEKAAIYLQYLLGDEPRLEEFSLPLNKLLCALPIEHPLTYSQPIGEKEKAFCEELLQSTIDNWDSLRGTSIPGFQGSFLNRQAVLKKQENGWLLQVEKMAFDMLLEQLPWPVSIVKLTWMDQPIYVEW